MGHGRGQWLFFASIAIVWTEFELLRQRKLFEEGGRYDEHTAAVQARARQFSQWLQARPEENIIVFGHGAIFAVLLGCKTQVNIASPSFLRRQAGCLT